MATSTKHLKQIVELYKCCDMNDTAFMAVAKIIKPAFLDWLKYVPGELGEFYKPVTHMTSKEIAGVLIKRPDLVGIFKTSILEDYGIYRVLDKQPALVTEIDISKLGLSSTYLLLSYNPELVHHLDASILGDSDKVCLVRKHPQLATQLTPINY
jgi:hypothetical protein